MIIETEEIIEYHENGNLKYKATLGYFSQVWVSYYPNQIIRPDGRRFVRINEAMKYRKDGNLEWRHVYDNYGNIIRSVTR